MSNVLIDESTMSNIANAIRSKTGKEDLILPKDMPGEIEGIENGMNDALLNSVINKTITDIVINTNIGSYTFFDCGKINPIFGDNCDKIGAYAFQNCGGLAEIDTNKVTVISSNAFMGLNKLAKAILPNVVELNNGVFANCKNITEIIIRSSTICNLKSTGAFLNTPIAQGTGYVYVPKALLEEYKIATNWTLYAAQFRAIEDYPEIAGGI